MTSTYFVYILRCVDDTLYTGVATDLSRRIEEHRLGRGAKYTRTHKPLEMVYHEEVGSRGEAQRCEAAIKKMTRAQKLELIASV